MVSEVTVLKCPACTGGRRGFGWCCGVIFVTLLFIASCCLRGKLNMPNPSEGESPNTARNLTGNQPAVIVVPVSIPLPEKLDVSSGNQVVKWQRLSRVWSNYAQLKGPENMDRNKERRTATLLTCIGLGALGVIDAMEFDTEDQRKDPEIIRTKIENVFNRRDQETNESVDAYVTTLRKLAKTCNYGSLTDSLTRDRMVVGIIDNSARKKLLYTSKLT